MSRVKRKKRESKRGISFGNYELTRLLGCGGMAEIFLALERGIEGMERQVAIKRILPQMSESEDFVTMFMDEARVATRFSHPNIAHTYSFGEVDGVYFLAMEYIDGVTCSELIRWNRGTIPLEIVLRVIGDVCAALAYVHDIRDNEGRLLGVVHRDVSPSNVIVSCSGVAKLLDFGVAHAATQVHTTEAGCVKGKMGYIAPEVFHGHRLDHRVDIFSAGVLFFEMIAGYPLFRREVQAATLASILNDDPPRLARSYDVPDAVDAIIGNAVEKDPTNRFSDAREMLDAVEKLIVQHRYLATPYRVGQFVEDQIKRNRKSKKQSEVITLTHIKKQKSRGDNPDDSPFTPNDSDGLFYPDVVESSLSEVSQWSFFSKIFRSSKSAGHVLGADPLLLEEDSLASSGVSLRRPAKRSGYWKTYLRFIALTIGVFVGLSLGAMVMLNADLYQSEVDESPEQLQNDASPVDSGTLADGPFIATPVKTSAEMRQPDASSLLAAENRVDTGPIKQKQAQGKLYLSTNPYAKARLGRRSLGTTPLIGVFVPAGNHIVRLVDANGKRHHRRIQIRPGEDTKVFFDLSKTSD